MAIVEISSRGKDVGPQPMAVAAVIYLLGVALLPLLRRLSQPGAADIAGPAQAHLATDPQVLRFDHTVIAVSDLDRANAFYRGVLGAELLTTPDGHVAYRIGGQQLNVHWPDSQAEPLAAVPVQPGNSDLCFIWSGSIATASEHLRGHGVEIIAGPVSRLGAQGPGQSVYFRDPDGSLIELISYE
jgi:catechol 2,3-dioxygenase-like lactoylglutathione lyase family enzyme